VKSGFQKIGECFYRYSSNGVYYARFEIGGKEIRRSLRTTDRGSSQRALAWLKQKWGKSIHLKARSRLVSSAMLLNELRKLFKARR